MKLMRSFAVCSWVLILFHLPARGAQAAAPPWDNILPGNIVAVTTLPPEASGDPLAAPVIIASRFSSDAGTYRSLDGGGTWELVDVNPAFSLAADPVTPGSFYAATYVGLLKFDNWGASTPVVLNASIRYSITVSPANPVVLFGDNLRSLDGGVSWTTMPLPAFDGGTPTAVGDNLPHIKASADPLSPGILLATCNSRQSYRSQNNGMTWTSLYSMIDTVAIDPTDARINYFGSCTSSSYRCVLGGACTSLALNPHIHDILVNPQHPNRLLAVTTTSGVNFSPDGGATWLANAPSSGIIREGRIHIDSATGLVYVPTGAGLIVRGVYCTDLDLDGFSPDGGGCGPVDCDDSVGSLNPSRTEMCLDNVDNDCDGLVDFAETLCSTYCTDADGDGHYPSSPSYCGGDDCDNNNANAHPGLTEILFDGIDQDCNGYDLTIAVTKAVHTRRNDTLTVEATSAQAQFAHLEVVGFGPLVWNAKRSKWAGTFVPAGGNPLEITVQGIEGSVTGSVSAR